MYNFKTIFWKPNHTSFGGKDTGERKISRHYDNEKEKIKKLKFLAFYLHFLVFDGSLEKYY